VVARAIVTDRFPADRIARTLASLTMVSVVSNSLAPTAGGYLVAGFGWRAIFAVLSVFGLAVAYFAWRGLPASPPRPGPPPRVREMVATGRRLMRDAVFLHCIVQSTVVYASFFVSMSLMPHLMADAFHRDRTAFGPYYLIVAAGYFFGNWSVQRFASPRGQHWMVGTGLAIQLAATLVGLALVLAHVDHPLALFIPLGVLAYGQGMMLPGVTATAVSRTQENVGVASSIIGFVPQLLGALALQGMGYFPTDTVLPVMTYCVLICVAGCIAFRAGPRLELARNA
jgi:DHA1 family bicyclomycin/chloramphenicol resistance-like MFS transporter